MADRRNFLKTCVTSACALAFNPLVDLAKETESGTWDRCRISLCKGDDRRKMTYDTLEPFRKEIETRIQGKQIFIKPNVVDYDYPLAVTHVDTLRGMLDFFSPLTDQKIIIGESTQGPVHTTPECFEVHGYPALEKEYNCQLLDLGVGPYTQVNWIKDAKKQVEYPYITSYVLDPTKFRISLARMKTHNLTVTLAMKNYIMGSCLNFPPGHPLYIPKFNSRTLMHNGGSYKGLSQNLVLMARHYLPDLAVVDGFQGMEGEGPSLGTPVDHRIMVAGFDTIAVDRVSLELMGFDFNMVKHVQWAADLGLGEGNLDNMDIIGEKIDDVRKVYQKSPYYAKSIQFISTSPEPDWTGVEDVKPIPLGITAYPNPFNASTAIEFSLPSSCLAELNIYNLKGQKIRELFSSRLGAGKHVLYWNGHDQDGRACSSGTYFLRIYAYSHIQVHKVTLLR